MTMERIVVYSSRTAAVAVSRWINARLGIPRRDHPTGPASAAEFEQARGWTTSECSLHDALDGSGECAIVLTEAAFALDGQPGPPSIDFSGWLPALPAKFVGNGTPDA